MIVQNLPDKSMVVIFSGINCPQDAISDETGVKGGQPSFNEAVPSFHGKGKEVNPILCISLPSCHL